MARRIKITGFARFILFIIVIVPIALVVSHMANNDWQFDQNKFLEDLNLKQESELLDPDTDVDVDVENDESTSEIEEIEPSPTQPTTPTTTEEQVEEIERPDYVQNDSLKIMKDYIEGLESELDNAKVEIDDLKNKLYQRDYLMNQIDSLQKVIEKRN